jgi:hypothetical protein
LRYALKSNQALKAAHARVSNQTALGRLFFAGSVIAEGIDEFIGEDAGTEAFESASLGSAGVGSDEAFAMDL